MLKIQLLLSFLFLFVFKAQSSSYIDKGYYVIDLKNKIEWLKCSAGQTNKLTEIGDYQLVKS